MSLKMLKTSCVILTESKTPEASGKLFSHFQQIQLVIQNTKDKAALLAPLSCRLSAP